ncbi:MAG: diguanylate cyclase [Gammaproteobacteria bacterium]|nr:diguanylate cyclase [Gammaproteobacteria bacterium]MBU1555776.1 diguanylate cyclase [Gammaproteobacteria bacterium]MBU2070072.1 diguanylate cyclase [Gammaproteobacteria bacterium]MBU2183632.1 diguanylate cyclase [Gammaproteobacteria bacterium]MBU2205606.1 diguanylate cyclase [Gammaproteobacteria bacterium]
MSPQTCIKLLLLLVLLLGSTYCRANQPLSLQHYSIENWTTQDGLPHSSINAITQTTDGYLWLATWEGPVRYNGNNFKAFNRKDSAVLANAGIRNFTQAADGSLYLAGVNGDVIRYSQQQWSSFRPVNSMLFDILPLADGDYLMATAGSGLLRLTGAEQQRLTRADGLPADLIYKIKQSPDGGIWLATAAGLVKLNPDFTAPAVLQHYFPAQQVYDLLFHENGSFIVATDSGVYRGWHHDPSPQFEQLTDTAAATLLVDHYGTLWFGGVSADLYRLNSANQVEALRLDNDLSANRVLSLFQDREHNIWVGTSNGLKRVREVPFTNLTTYNGLQDNFVRTVLEHPDGSLWIGSTAGLDRYATDGSITPVLQHTSVLSLALGQHDSIWVGTHNQGLLHIAEQQLVRQYSSADGLASNNIRAILPGGNILWLATANGVHQLNSDTGIISRIPEPTHNSYILSLQLLPDNRLVIGTNEGAGIWFDNTYTPLSAQPENNNRRVLGQWFDQSSGDIWLATDKGLGRCRQQQLQFIGLEAGLLSDTVLQVVPDRLGNLWLTTNRGIVRLNLAAANAYLDNPASPLAMQLFNEKDGMRNAQSNGGSSPAAITRADGSIAVATAGGVAIIQPQLLHRFVPQTPLIQFESIMANGKLQPPGDLITLKAGTERLAIRLAGLGFVAPERLRFRSKLEGFDENWIEREDLRLTEYTNLSPGLYQFEAAVSYAGGDWSPAISQQFLLQPHVWQRKLFWFVLIGLSLLSIAAILRWRIRLSLSRELQLQRLVAEKTQALQLQTTHLLEMDKERQQLLNKIQQQADFFAAQARLDSLTGLGNRRAFEEACRNEFIRIQRYPHPLCLAIVDIDHFKSINDNWSHTVGDYVIQRVAKALQAGCRETDITARWGGEEFVLLLPETTTEQALTICEKLRQRISELDLTDIASDLHVTASFGVALRQQEPAFEAVLAKADKALYAAKVAGRNRVMLADD